eukprot:UN11548
MDFMIGYKFCLILVDTCIRTFLYQSMKSSSLALTCFQIPRCKHNLKKLYELPLCVLILLLELQGDEVCLMCCGFFRFEC